MNTEKLEEIIANLENNYITDRDYNYEGIVSELLDSLGVDANYQENYDKIADNDISTFDLDNLKTMYTYLRRGERFCRGFIVSNILDGTVLKLAKRHLELICDTKLYREYDSSLMETVKTKEEKNVSFIKNQLNIFKNKISQEALSDEDLTLLVNACKKKIATVDGDGYEEIVLYVDEKNNEYYLHTYVKYVGMQKEEHASYVANKEIKDKVFKYIEDNNLVSWKDNKGVPLCGADYILKFKYNGEIIRLDSSKMLDNLKAYFDISKMLYSETIEENRRYLEK